MVLSSLRTREWTSVTEVQALTVAVGVAQIGIRVVLVRQGLLARAPSGEELALLAVAPLHAPVLEPDLHLKNKKGCVVSECVPLVFESQSGIS